MGNGVVGTAIRVFQLEHVAAECAGGRRHCGAGVCIGTAAV